MFDLSDLGEWQDLRFFTDTLPEIEQSLASETKAIYPPSDQVFAALKHTQPDQVKVVILGQDPYPQAGKAHGLAFSIPNDFPPRTRRDSLDNISQELNDDLGIELTGTDLSHWARQGVLLFNALALTVPDRTAGGHRKLGWRALTREVLHRLSDRPRAYLLWGKDAHDAAEDVDLTSNFIVRSSHPSPMGVNKNSKDFVAFRGSRPFGRTNVWLQQNNLAPINWGDPEGP